MPLVRPSVSRRTGPLLAVALFSVIQIACGSSASPAPVQSSSAPVQLSPTNLPSAPNASAPDPSPSLPTAIGSPSETGFEFSASAVAAFYESEGLTCGAPTPSRTAAGWSVTVCRGPDPSGRTVTIGLITDQDGTLGAGFAAVTALPEEDLLEPADALDTLSGFLGAMLGDERATDLLPWLAGNMGNEYEEMAAGDLTVATYLESSDDPTRIYVEVAGPSYLAVPPP